MDELLDTLEAAKRWMDSYNQGKETGLDLSYDLIKLMLEKHGRA
jgi:hypothetical protein